MNIKRFIDNKKLNYVMQDYYMSKAMAGGWETPKIIGYDMGLIFTGIENLVKAGKIVICMAHPETYKADNAENISYRMKTTGNMTQQFITPEGKFTVVLFGKSYYDEKNKKSIHTFVTGKDGQYPGKSPIGMFSELYIPNDLGYVIDKIKEYYS